MKTKPIARARTLALACVALLLGLSACTGTFEATEPLLLVVGLEDGGGAPQVALIEDRFSPVQSTSDRLVLLEDSRRPLPYPAVSADVIQRAGLRSELVLLTRELDVAAPQSELRFFDLDGIDPADPVGFDVSTQHPTVVLSGAPGALLDEAGGVGACPTAVQASRDGRYIAVLDNRRVCSGVGSDLVTLYLIDVNASPPAIVFSSGGQPLVAAAPFLDQAGGDEHLYYLVSGINTMLIYRMTLPSGSSSPYLGLSLPGTEASVLRADRDMLVALSATQLRSVKAVAGAPAGLATTVTGARALAVDATGTTEQLVVVGSSQTAVHASPADAKPTLLSFSGDAAVIDPLNRFAYVMRDQVLYIVDLLAVTAGNSGGLFAGTSLPELNLPQEDGASVAVMEWTRAVTPIAP